jgi:Clp amino terminal domain, pathogenicity island component
MARDEMSGPYLEAIRRGFLLAHELGQRCGPAHLLVGVAEGDGPAAAALDPGEGRSLRGVVAADAGAGDAPAGDAGGPGGGMIGSSYGGLGHLHMQAQGAAMALAESRGEPVGAEHLLIALLDQGTPSVLEALGRAGLDPGTVRQAAATAIGAPGLPPTELPSRTPAGTLDRPPLPVSELDERAWTALRWRQEHLPVGRLHRPSDREALLRLEQDEAWRVADRLALDDDQRYSLISRHGSEVARHVERARPDLAKPPRPRDRAEARAVALARGRRRRLGRTVALRHVTVGWGVWFGNRRVGLRDRWFRLRTTSSYRGAPQL